MEIDLSIATLGWAVLHSLWELALLGLVAWITLRAMARCSPRLRYCVALGLLALMVLAFLVATARFSVGWSSPRTLVWMESQTKLPADTAAPVKPFTLVPGVGAVPGAHPWIGNLSAWSGSLWLLGCLLMSLRLSWTWFRERRLFHSELVAVEDVWITRLGELCRRLGLRTTVLLRVSTRVESPMTWGWLRPIILLPASSFLHLNPDALEAMLVHELAHVRRLDYLAGLLQSMAEVLLFYHPALWWLSHQLRELRELCCDDAVMELLGDPLPYAEGLASLERQRLPHLVQASQRGNLMFRITRMLNPDCVHPMKRSALVLFLASGLAGGLLLAGSREQQKPHTVFSSSAVFCYSTGATKALGIEGYDPALAQALMAPPDRRDQAAYDNWEKTKRNSASAIVDWTLAQVRLRLEALHRGEKPSISSFEAPPVDPRGRPREMPFLVIDMAKPHRHFSFHPPLDGHPGAVSFHLETLDARGSITPEGEQIILQEALELLQSIRGEGYAWTDTRTTREAPATAPIVSLPVPQAGTCFLVSTGEGRSLRVVGFEKLLPKGEFDPQHLESQLNAIESWAQARLRERERALRQGEAMPLVSFSDLNLDVTGSPREATIFAAGDKTALAHGQPGQLFSIHPARHGQRASLSFRLACIAAFSGRVPSKEEELRMLQEARQLLTKQQRGEIGENSVAVPARTESSSSPEPSAPPPEGLASSVVLPRARP